MEEIMKIKALFLMSLIAVLGAGCCNVCPWNAGNQPEPFGMKVATTAVPRFQFVESPKGWHRRYNIKRQELARFQNAPDMIYIGDSITHGWDNPPNMRVQKKFFPNLNILNLGHSGDRTEHQLWIARDSGFLDKAKAKLVVVLIGTNNIGHKKSGVEATIAGTKLIVETIREKQPQAKVLLFGIFPRGERPDNPFRAQIKAINAQLQLLADNENIFYEDLADKLLEKDGSLTKETMYDYLHLTAQGYTIWTEAIKPYAERFCK
jgi:beta-glucosidase